MFLFLFLGFFLVFGFIRPVQIHNNLSASFILLFFVLGIVLGIVSGLSLEYNSLKSKNISNAVWDETLSRNLNISYGQFIAFILLAYGLGSVAKNLVAGIPLNIFGFILISLGIGVFIGLILSKKNRKEESDKKNQE